MGLLSFSLPENDGWEATPFWRRWPIGELLGEGRGEERGEARGEPRGDVQGEPMELTLWFGDMGTSRLDDPGNTLGRV